MKKKNTIKPHLLGGIVWSAFMYLFMVILIPLSQDEEITKAKLLFGIPVWIIGGLLYAFISSYFMNRKATSILVSKKSLKSQSK